MMKVLDEIFQQCGFIGTLIISGIDPDVSNSVMTLVFHTGKTSTGLSFGDANLDLKASLTSSFNAFAHKCLGKQIASS